MNEGLLDLRTSASSFLFLKPHENIFIGINILGEGIHSIYDSYISEGGEIQPQFVELINILIMEGSFFIKRGCSYEKSANFINVLVAVCL